MSLENPQILYVGGDELSENVKAAVLHEGTIYRATTLSSALGYFAACYPDVVILDSKVEPRLSASVCYQIMTLDAPDSVPIFILDDLPERWLLTSPTTRVLADKATLLNELQKAFIPEVTQWQPDILSSR